MTVFIVCYVLSSSVAGYVSGGFYSRNSGKTWIRAMVLTATVFPVRPTSTPPPPSPPRAPPEPARAPAARNEPPEPA